jgi:hypothetical protein
MRATITRIGAAGETGESGRSARRSACLDGIKAVRERADRGPRPLRDEEAEGRRVVSIDARRSWQGDSGQVTLYHAPEVVDRHLK